MNADPYKFFRTEARELIEGLTKGALALEKGQSDKPLVSQLLRYAHTLKGAARIVKQPRIAEISHAIEEALAPYRQDPSGISSEVIRQLLSHIDAISAALAVLDAPPSPERPTPPSTPSQPPAPQAEPPEGRLESIRVGMADMDALLRSVAEMRVHLSALEHQAQALHHAGLAARQWVSQRRLDPWAAGNHEDMDRLLSGAEDIGDSLRDMDQGLRAALDRAQREWNQLFEQASELRLVPAGSIFPVLERAVRDAAEATGKRVDFVTSGGDTRLDAHGLSLLRSALLHLVRNAVAHGVEPEPQRLAAGKPPAGRVELRVERRADRAVFTCRDDGKGIDLEPVRKALLSRGLVTPDEARSITPDAAMGLLLRAGISTARHVTELSGRGIGLDVVRQAVASLKGTTCAHSEPGAGTSIEVSVPVSIESVEVLHVDAGGTALSIPLQAIRQAVRLTEADLARSAKGVSIVHDGQTVPFVHLGSILQRKVDLARRTQPITALVLEASGGTAAVGVEHLRGRERVVVRSMPNLLGPVPAIMGAFFDSEGNPQLVLDPAGVVEVLRSEALPAGEVEPAARPAVLVIDDSLTTRMLEQGILQAAGYDVDTAASGEEALQKARQRRYGVFIVDLEMPGMNGFEFVGAARADVQLSRVPSIIVTSRDSAEDRGQADRLGVKAYFVKSRFDERLLLETIRGLIG